MYEYKTELPLLNLDKLNEYLVANGIAATLDISQSMNSIRIIFVCEQDASLVGTNKLTRDTFIHRTYQLYAPDLYCRRSHHLTRMTNEF